MQIDALGLHVPGCGGTAGDLQRLALDSSRPRLSLAKEPLVLQSAGFFLLSFFPERDQ